MDKTYNYQYPLTGLNVIDFGHYYAGPMAGMLLADQGATVIRIVKPGERELCEQKYRLLNRNKKLLTLDLKSDSGKNQVKSLIKQADILIENFRPGVMKRLELDYPSVKKDNPGLIYLSLPGFASNDTERAQMQAWEGILCAAAAVYSNLNITRQILKYPPVYTSAPQCSTYGAIHGAQAIMAALVARQKHSMGIKIEVPLVDAGFSGFALPVQAGSSGISRALDKTDAELPPSLKAFEYNKKDNKSEQLEKIHKGEKAILGGLSSGSFTCKDGRELYFSLYLNNRFTKQLFAVLGIDQKINQKGFVYAGHYQSGLNNNLDLLGALGTDHAQWLNNKIGEILLTKPAREWEEILGNNGIPAIMARTRDEWLGESTLLKSGVFTQLKGNKKIPLTVPSRIADISPPGSKHEQPTINYNEAQTITIKEAGKCFANHPKSTNTFQNFSNNKGDLLKGLKVLDLCNVIAGPTGTNLLAQYGADVIKAEALDTHPLFLPSGLEINQGKRSIIIDIKTKPGSDVLKRLLTWADVVVHNLLDDTAQRFGLRHKQLQNTNPNLIACQLSAFGGTHRGGWENRPGFDNLLQAGSGLMAHFGTLKEPKWHGMVSSADTIGGIGLAFSALLAVYHHRQSGYAGEVRTSLARATNHYQLPNMISEKGASDRIEPSGQLAVGEHYWQRIYACKDGWIFVGTKQANSLLLINTVNTQAENLSPKDVEEILEATFASSTCLYWLTKLRATDIACHQVVSIDDICAKGTRNVCNEAENETVTESCEILCWEDHPCGYPVVLLAQNCVRTGENLSSRRLSPAPRVGQHTLEILQELEFTSDEISTLKKVNIAHEYLPNLGDSLHFLKP